MTELRQRRWFNKKHIQIVGDAEIVIHNKRLFDSEEEKFRLADSHPFFERNVYNAMGYALSALLLFVLAVASFYCAPNLHMKFAGWLLSFSGLVTTVLYFYSKEARYDFFERGSGNFIFRIWQTRSGEEKIFVQNLLRLIDENYENRFSKARLIINSQVRKKVAEQACYFLYQRGMLDFSELESLIINIEQRFHQPLEAFNDKVENKTNIIDLAKYSKEKAVESS